MLLSVLTWGVVRLLDASVSSFVWLAAGLVESDPVPVGSIVDVGCRAYLTGASVSRNRV